jgi:hypothetical protein
MDNPPRSESWARAMAPQLDVRRGLLVYAGLYALLAGLPSTAMGLALGVGLGVTVNASQAQLPWFYWSGAVLGLGLSWLPFWAWARSEVKVAQRLLRDGECVVASACTPNGVMFAEDVLGLSVSWREGGETRSVRATIGRAKMELSRVDGAECHVLWNANIPWVWLLHRSGYASAVRVQRPARKC